MHERQKVKLCANYKAHDGFHPYAAKTVGVNCKDCVYFSAKNCGAHSGAGVYKEMMG